MNNILNINLFTLLFENFQNQILFSTSSSPSNLTHFLIIAENDSTLIGLIIKSQHPVSKH